ncbi:MAG: hypothetical protein WD097_03050 [Balneolales bacterium]
MRTGGGDHPPQSWWFNGDVDTKDALDDDNKVTAGVSASQLPDEPSLQIRELSPGLQPLASGVVGRTSSIPSPVRASITTGSTAPACPAVSI